MALVRGCFPWVADPNSSAGWRWLCWGWWLSCTSPPQPKHHPLSGCSPHVPLPEICQENDKTLCHCPWRGCGILRCCAGWH